MGKGQGKGKDKGCFYSFIDDNYFAYYFLQWAIAFIIIGAIFIIAGAVAGSLYPGKHYRQYAKEQQLTSGEGSANFDQWKVTRSLVKYTFNNFTTTSGSLQCTPTTFTYDLTDTKANIVFSGDSSYVNYTIQQVKSLRTDSVTSLFLSSLNPKYIELVKHKTTEKTLFAEALLASNFTSNQEKLFKTIAPNLIGARYFAEKLPASIKTVIDSNVFPSVYSASTGLIKAINDYELRYTIDKLMKINCEFCTTNLTGIYSSLHTSFISNPNCRGTNALTPTEDNFKTSLVQGFNNLLGTDPCVVFLKAHGLNSATWSGKADLASTILSYMGSVKNINSFIDLDRPTAVGYCNDYAGAATFFNTTTPFIQDICENFIPLWYSSVPEKASNLGKKAFCAPTPGNIALAPLPYTPTTIGKYFSSLGLPLNYTSTYNEAECAKYVTALTDVNGFVLPAYYGKATSQDNILSANEIQLLKNYILKFKEGYERYFVNLWRNANYNCPSCDIRPLYEIVTTFPGAGVFGSETSLHPIFFRNTSIYSVSYDPKPVKLAGKTMYDDIASATGILVYMYKLDEAAIKGLFNLDGTQLLAFQNYATLMAGKLVQSIASQNGLSTSQDVGLLQFAQAKLACGTIKTGRCSIAQEFFGETTPYVAELGIASYVPSPQVGYPDSFGNGDVGLRDSVTATQAQTVLTDLATPNPVILRDASDLSRKYLHYVFNTFTRDFVSPSSTGLVATKSITEFLEGSSDDSVVNFGSGSNIDPFRAVDPSASGRKDSIQTGIYDSFKSYTFETFDSSSKLNAYGQNEDVSGIYNSEQLPPDTVKPGFTALILDSGLKRSFNYVFGSSLNSSEAVPFYTATVLPDDWKSTKYVTSDNYMPVPGSGNVEFYSPCGVALTDSCALGASAAPSSISVEPKTGLVVLYTTCYVRSVALGVKFPISASAVPETSRFSIVQREFVREISPEQSGSYSTMVSTTKNNSIAILASLISVGCLFIVVGIVFIVFYLIKKKREDIAKAKSDLVNDPFGENKNKNEVYLRD